MSYGIVSILFPLIVFGSFAILAATTETQGKLDHLFSHRLVGILSRQDELINRLHRLG